MQEKKVSPVFRALKALVKCVYGRYETVGLENLPDEPSMIIANHAQLHGPLACELYFPVPRSTWCIGQMLHMKEVPAYAFEDFWSKKPLSVRWLFKIASYLIAWPASFIMRNAETIGVYHDHRLVSTFRETTRALQAGRHVVVFPECYDLYNPIVYQFQQGFVDAARLYYKKTGKAMLFTPMYIAPALKRFVIGKPVAFNPDAPIEEERARISEALMREITDLAVAQPRHAVVPYPNVPKRDYPLNILPKE